MDIFEALQLLKSVYRSGHTAAIHQASQHVNTLIMVLDDGVTRDVIVL
jgi:hypothetical protein